MIPLLDNKNYYITLCGRVFSIDRYELLSGRHEKPYLRFRKGKELKRTISNTGYYTVTIYKYGKSKKELVHRLMAKTYLPNPLNLPEVNHKNLNKLDNNISNLEWVSRKDNLKHAEDNGMKRIGSLIGTSILSEKDVLEIVTFLNKGVSQTEIAKLYKVTNHAIYRIAKGKNWSWLTKIGREEVQQ